MWLFSIIHICMDVKVVVEKGEMRFSWCFSIKHDKDKDLPTTSDVTRDIYLVGKHTQAGRRQKNSKLKKMINY